MPLCKSRRNTSGMPFVSRPSGVITELREIPLAIPPLVPTLTSKVKFPARSRTNASVTPLVSFGTKSLALLSVEERDALFWTTRINLSPNKTDNWQMPSPVRVGMALLAKRGIALDRTPQQTRQSRLVESCPEGMSFVDFALFRLGGNWREAAQIAFDRFRSELPMKEITERILEESLASVIP